MFSLKRLFIIITAFIGMTCGCETDRFGNPVLLHSDTQNPHQLDADCWYSISSSQTQHVSAVIERPSETEKLAIYWEEIDPSSAFTVLFDWTSVPVYNIQQNQFWFNFFLSGLGEDGSIVYHMSPNNQDIYHCLDGYYGCEQFKQNSSVGNLYITFIALGSSDVNVGRFKVGWVKQRTYIKPAQLSTVKNMWIDCCKDTFVHPSNIDKITTKIDYQTVFTKTNCDLVLSNKSIDSLNENSCEDINHVVCDDNGDVVGLYVSDHGLKCENFIDHVLKFQHLTDLFASNNHLSGSIEPLTKLEKLTTIALSDNYFTGSIPCFTNKDMITIEIGMNKLTGVIPSCLDKLGNLNIIDFSNNPFSLQPFPYFLKMFEKLEIIDLVNTNLHGSINNVFNLPSLQVLKINSNYLSGNFPSSLVGSEELSIVDVSFNFFSGEIPKLSSSQVRGIYGMNSFSGDLTELLKDVPFNLLLDISHNKFGGTIPDEVVKILLTKNLVLYMKGNNFECDPGTNSWSKTILHMNSILNLGKCSMNEDDPCNPCEQCDPCDVYEPCKNSTQSPAYYPLESSTDSSILDDTGKMVMTIIVIISSTILIAMCILKIITYYKTKRNNYLPAVNPEEMSVISTENNIRATNV